MLHYNLSVCHDSSLHVEWPVSSIFQSNITIKVYTLAVFRFAASMRNVFNQSIALNLKDVFHTLVGTSLVIYHFVYIAVDQQWRSKRFDTLRKKVISEVINYKSSLVHVFDEFNSTCFVLTALSMLLECSIVVLLSKYYTIDIIISV